MQQIIRQLIFNRLGERAAIHQHCKLIGHFITPGKFPDDAVAAGVSSLNAESNNAKGDNGGTTLWWDKKTH